MDVLAFLENVSTVTILVFYIHGKHHYVIHVKHCESRQLLAKWKSNVHQLCPSCIKHCHDDDDLFKHCHDDDEDDLFIYTTPTHSYKQKSSHGWSNSCLVGVELKLLSLSLEMIQG